MTKLKGAAAIVYQEIKARLAESDNGSGQVITYQELAQATGYHLTTVKNVVPRLRAMGLIETEEMEGRVLKFRLPTEKPQD